MQVYIAFGGIRSQNIFHASSGLSLPCKLEMAITTEALRSQQNIFENNVTRVMHISMALQQGGDVQPDFILQPLDISSLSKMLKQYRNGTPANKPLSK